MKKFIVLPLLSMLFIPPVFSQEADHIRGGRFQKIVEQNGLFRGTVTGPAIGLYNTENKPPLGKIFFGLTNFPVEFVIETSFGGNAGLRLFRGDNYQWMLEVVPFVDNAVSAKAVQAVRQMTEKKDIPGELLDLLPQEYQNEIKEHNEKAPVAAAREATYEPYRPETKTFTLHHMGDNLYEKTVALIDNFKGKGIPGWSADGYSVTFRCVVGDEVWTLRIHMPQKRALQLSNLFRQIIEDTREGKKFDEWKYVRMLEPIEF